MRAYYFLYSNNLLLYYMMKRIFNIKGNGICYEMQGGHFSKFIKHLRSFFQQTSVLYKCSFSCSPSCLHRAGGWSPLNDLELIKVCPLFSISSWSCSRAVCSCLMTASLPQAPSSAVTFLALSVAGTTTKLPCPGPW